MDVFPKFIVEGDSLIIAKATYHYQLVIDKDIVKGGGWWSLDKNLNTFKLYGDSHDFGKASIEDIRNCIEKGNVYTNKYQTHSIYDKYKFIYDTGSEIIEL